MIAKVIGYGLLGAVILLLVVVDTFFIIKLFQ